MASDQWNWNIPIERVQLTTGNSIFSGINENSTFSSSISEEFCETAEQNQSHNGNTHCQVADPLVPNISHPPYQCPPQHYVHPQLQQPVTWTSNVPQNTEEFPSTSCSAESQPNAQSSAVSPFPVIQQNSPMLFSNPTNEVPSHVTDVITEEVSTNSNLSTVIKPKRKRGHPDSITKSTIRKRRRHVSPKKKITLSIQDKREKERKKKQRLRNRLKKPKIYSYVIESDPVTVPELTIVQIKCPHCPIDFKTQYSCDLHVKRVHRKSVIIPRDQESPTHICKVCSKSFPATNKLIAHLWRMHYQDTTLNFKCPFCDATRNHSRALKPHIEFHHPSEADTYVFGITSQLATASKFRCNSCPALFDTFFKLNEHVISCHGKLKYECKVCGTLLTTLEHLDYHMQLLHPQHFEIGESSDCKPKEINTKKMFKCLSCQSYFLTKSFLNLHQKAVHKKCPVNPKYKHKCTACSTPFEVRKIMIKHYTSCYARTDLNCYWCTDVFSTEDARENHFKEHHSRQKLIPKKILYKPYKCEFCYRNFFTIVSLRIHFNLRHMGMVEQFEKVYPSRSSFENTNIRMNKFEDFGKTEATDSNELDSEIRVDIKVENCEEIDPLINTCPICEKSFSGEEFHSYHKSYERLSRKACEICNKLFADRSAVLIHQKRMHGDAQISQPQPPPSSSSIESEATFWCSVCYSSSTATIFHKHHSVFELNEDKQICEFCNRMFFHKRSLDLHVRKEHSDDPKPDKRKRNYEKPDMQLSLSLANELPTSLSVGLVVHTCNECLINFKTPEFLSQHILTKHGGVINTNLKPCCKICNKTFSNMGHFHRHRRLLHDVNAKKFPCLHCPMTLGRLEDLRTHILKRHGSDPTDIKVPIRRQTPMENKTFKCKFCCRAFMKEEALKRHLNNVHFPQICETFCDYCGMQISPERLEKHIQVEHPEHKVEDPPPRGRKSPSSYSKISVSEILKLVKEINEQTKSVDTKKRSNSKNCESKKSKKNPCRKKSSDSDSEQLSEYSAEESDTTSCDDSDEDWISDVEHNSFMNEASESENENPLSLKEIIKPLKKKRTVRSSKTSEVDDSKQSSILTNTRKSKRKIREVKLNFSSPFQPEDDSDEDFIPNVYESDEEFILPTTTNPKTRRKSKRKSARLIQRGDIYSPNEISDSPLKNPTTRPTTKKKTRIDSVRYDWDAIKMPLLILHRCDDVRNFEV